ncbi:MAG: hypothetical protein J6L81_03385 [Clostridia bacterium]|nr:hypothetical protein [Clostridia bacterium]
MKRLPTIYKCLLLILINSCPFVFDIVFYKNGMTDNLYLFIPIFASLTVLNYWICKKTVHYLFIQLYVLICAFVSGYISTLLYYRNISDDWATPVVGMMITLICGSIVVITIIVTVVIKATINKKRRSLES